MFGVMKIKPAYQESLYIVGYVLVLVAAYWLVSLTKPDCQDSALKRNLTFLAQMAPWVLCGAHMWFRRASKCLFRSLGLFLFGYLAVIVVWMVSLWHTLSPSFYWLLLSHPRPICRAFSAFLLGGLVGRGLSVIQAKHAEQSDAANRDPRWRAVRGG